MPSQFVRKLSPPPRHALMSAHSRYRNTTATDGTCRHLHVLLNTVSVFARHIGPAAYWRIPSFGSKWCFSIPPYHDIPPSHDGISWYYTTMIERSQLLARIRQALRRSRVVALIGPRQCGKTTLARQIEPNRSGNYFDLEDPASLARLDQPMTALESLRGIVVIDEIQRRPNLLPILRVLADRKPLAARFLILGSASPDLLRQSSESLAGRRSSSAWPLTLSSATAKRKRRGS
jgi:hypothetical protein